MKCNQGSSSKKGWRTADVDAEINRGKHAKT